MASLLCDLNHIKLSPRFVKSKARKFSTKLIGHFSATDSDACRVVSVTRKNLSFRANEWEPNRFETQFNRMYNNLPNESDAESDSDLEMETMNLPRTMSYVPSTLPSPNNINSHSPRTQMTNHDSQYPLRGRLSNDVTSTNAVKPKNSICNNRNNTTNLMRGSSAQRPLIIEPSDRSENFRSSSKRSKYRPIRSQTPTIEYSSRKDYLENESSEPLHRNLLHAKSNLKLNLNPSGGTSEHVTRGRTVLKNSFSSKNPTKQEGPVDENSNNTKLTNNEAESNAIIRGSRCGKDSRFNKKCERSSSIPCKKTTQHIIEGTVKIKGLEENKSSQDLFLILFNDSLLFAKKSGKILKPKLSVLVSDLWCYEVKEEKTESDTSNELILGWPMQTVTACFKDSQTKSIWKASFHSCIMNQQRLNLDGVDKIQDMLSVTVAYGSENREVFTNEFATASQLLQKSLELFNISPSLLSLLQLSVVNHAADENNTKFYLHGPERIVSILRYIIHDLPSQNQNPAAHQQQNPHHYHNPPVDSDSTINQSAMTPGAPSKNTRTNIYQRLSRSEVAFSIETKEALQTSTPTGSNDANESNSTEASSGRGNFFINGLSKVSAKGARLRARSLDRNVAESKRIENWNKSRDKSVLGSNKNRKHNQLFGIPLEALCNKDDHQKHHLPLPILDIMYRLYSRGILVDGVFRKPSRQKDKIECIELLNQSKPLHVEELHPFLMADLLKEFLRLLPSCVLVSEKYQTWLSIVAVQDNTSRTQLLKNTIHSLPKCHFDLCIRVFFILYSVTKCQENIKPNSLSTCIAPSILFPKEVTAISCGNPAANLVVAEIIENYEEIFGQQVGQIEREFLEQTKKFETPNCINRLANNSPSTISQDSGIGQTSLVSIENSPDEKELQKYTAEIQQNLINKTLIQSKNSPMFQRNGSPFHTPCSSYVKSNTMERKINLESRKSRSDDESFSPKYFSRHTRKYAVNVGQSRRLDPNFDALENEEESLRLRSESAPIIDNEHSIKCVPVPDKQLFSTSFEGCFERSKFETLPPKPLVSKFQSSQCNDSLDSFDAASFTDDRERCFSSPDPSVHKQHLFIRNEQKFSQFNRPKTGVATRLSRAFESGSQN